jgi:hypothetical protein
VILDDRSCTSATPIIQRSAMHSVPLAMSVGDPTKVPPDSSLPMVMNQEESALGEGVGGMAQETPKEGLTQEAPVQVTMKDGPTSEVPTKV